MSNAFPIPGPLSLGELLDRSFRLYRARFGALLLTAAAVMIPIGIIQGVTTTRSYATLTGATERLAADPNSTQAAMAVLGPTLSYFGQTFLVTLLLLLAYGLVSLALSIQSAAALHGETLTVGEGLRRGLRRVPALIGMGILQGLAYLGITLVVMIPLIILGVIAAAAIGAGGAIGGGDNLAVAGATVAILCGYLVAVVLVMIPWLYLAARWVAALPALALENLGATKALGRSWRLTKKRVWRSFGYVFLLSLLSLLVISLPLIVIQQALLAVLPLAQSPVILGLSTALSSLLGVLWQPLYAAAIVLFYYDLRVRTEDYDLTQRVDALAATVVEPAVPVGAEDPL